MVRGGVVVSRLRVFVTFCSEFWMLAEQFWKQLRNGTGSFPVLFPGWCSVVTTWFCGKVPLGGDVWFATVVFS